MHSNEAGIQWRREPPDKPGVWLVSSGARIVSIHAKRNGRRVVIDEDDMEILGAYFPNRLLWSGPHEIPFAELE